MKRILGILLAVLFLPCGLIFQLLFSVNSWLFNPQFYASLLDNPGIYNALYVAAGFSDAQQMLAVFADTPIASQIDAIYQPNPDEWRRQTTSIIDQFVGLLDGQRDQITFQVNITGMRSLVTSETGSEFLRVYPESLLPCGVNDDPFSQPGILESLPLPGCIPPGFNEASLGALLVRERDTIISQWPEELTYIISGAGMEESIASFAGFRDSSRSTLFTIGFISLILLLVSAWFGMRSGRKRLLWAGILLLIPSVLLFLISSAIVSLIISQIGFIVASSDILMGQLLGSVSGGFWQIGNSFTWTSFWFGLVGAVMVIVGLGIDRLNPGAVAAVTDKAKRVSQTAVDDLRHQAQEAQLGEKFNQASDRIKSTTSSVVQQAKDTVQSESVRSATSNVVQQAKDVVQSERVRSVTSGALDQAKNIANSEAVQRRSEQAKGLFQSAMGQAQKFGQNLTTQSNQPEHETIIDQAPSDLPEHSSDPSESDTPTAFQDHPIESIDDSAPDSSIDSPVDTPEDD